MNLTQVRFLNWKYISSKPTVLETGNFHNLQKALVSRSAESLIKI